MDDYSEKMKLENEIFGLDYSIEKEYGHIRELKIQLENLLLMEILKLTVKSTSRNNQAIIGRLLNKEEAMTVENELSVKTIESLIERSSEITDRIIKEHHENNERLKHQKDELYKSGCP